MNYQLKTPIVSCKIYGSPLVGIIVKSSAAFAVSSTNKNGFSPSKVSITRSPLSFLPFPH